MKHAKMSQNQIKCLLGISSSSFHKWFAEKNNPKHNLALIISDMSVDEVKKRIIKIKGSHIS